MLRLYGQLMTCNTGCQVNVGQYMKCCGQLNCKQTEYLKLFTLLIDNGGGGNAGADNSPLNGDKGTYLNGGIQAAAFVTTPLLSQTGVEYTGLLHVSDWLPTLVNLAGGDVSDLSLDGFDVWESIRSVTNLKYPMFKLTDQIATK